MINMLNKKNLAQSDNNLHQKCLSSSAQGPINASNNDVSINLPVLSEEAYLGFYNEFSDYNTLRDITTYTPLTYPDMKLIREIILEEAGKGKHYQLQCAHSLQDIIAILSDTKFRRELYICTGLNYEMMDYLQTLLEKYARFMSPARPIEQYESWYVIDAVHAGKMGADMFDILLPYKAYIQFGWHDKEMFYHDINVSHHKESTGYHALSLYMVLRASSVSYLSKISEVFENKILYNDLNGSSPCYGRRMSPLQARKLSSGYDPMDILCPIIIKEDSWKNSLEPALIQFDRHICL